MPIPATDKRHYRVSEDQAFRLYGGNKLYSLDDLSEAINLIDQDTFRHHVDESKNDFANWVEHVFDEPGLANQLREHPTPLRMMVSIERFLRQSELAANPTPAPASIPSETAAMPATPTTSRPSTPDAAPATPTSPAEAPIAPAAPVNPPLQADPHADQANF